MTKLICDNCKQEQTSLAYVFTTTPDTVRNRLDGNFDALWCNNCIMESGQKTTAQKLHELSLKRKHEKTQ